MWVAVEEGNVDTLRIKASSASDTWWSHPACNSLSPPLTHHASHPSTHACIFSLPSGAIWHSNICSNLTQCFVFWLQSQLQSYSKQGTNHPRGYLLFFFQLWFWLFRERWEMQWRMTISANGRTYLVDTQCWFVLSVLTFLWRYFPPINPSLVFVKRFPFFICWYWLFPVFNRSSFTSSWHYLDIPLWLVRWFLWRWCLYVRACHVLFVLDVWCESWKWWRLLSPQNDLGVIIDNQTPYLIQLYPHRTNLSRSYICRIFLLALPSWLVHIFFGTGSAFPGRLFEWRLHIYGKILLVLFSIFLQPALRIFVHLMGSEKSFMGDDDNFWLLVSRFDETILRINHLTPYLSGTLRESHSSLHLKLFPCLTVYFFACRLFPNRSSRYQLCVLATRCVWMC